MLKIGKFYDSSWKTKEAFNSFAEMNAWAIERAKKYDQRVIMRDGTEYLFITLEDRQKAIKIQGMCFHVADFDLGSCFPEDVRNYVKAHLRRNF